MRVEAARAYGLVVLAALIGVIGMGMIFDGMTHGSFVETSRGVPLFLTGLWWDGRELSRSMVISRAKGAASDMPARRCR